MLRFDLIFGFIALGLFIFALVDAISIHEWRIKTLNKLAWVAIIVILPLLGPVLWLTLGKQRNSPENPPTRRPGRSVAPDDDPEFLRTASTFESQEARIRRLEAELKALNDDQPEE